jgi:spore germination cell wall hydrolase CwlJ-like protein
MTVTGLAYAIGYDPAKPGGILALNRVRILVLAAFLNGCASVHPPVTDPDKNEYDNKPLVESATKDDAAAQKCLALAMYWEARGEGHRGMLAVGSVVLNRVEDDRFPDTVCDVVYQGGETPPCQFSWWCDGKSDRPSHQASWERSRILADSLLTARPQDPTNGALFFHTKSVRPPWRREQTVQIGNHVFYR